MSYTFMLNKDNLTSWLVQLCRQQRLVAPVRNSYGDTLYCVVEDPTTVEIDLLHQPQNSIKSFLFPQMETMSHYHLERNAETGHCDYQFKATLPEPVPTLYFGVRSCDMNAVTYFDTIFNPKTGPDPYYQQRRQGAMFATLVCEQPAGDHCFCDKTKTGPSLTQGFDLQMIDIGASFYVTTTGHGGASDHLVAPFATLFSSPTEADETTRQQVEERARLMVNAEVDVERCVSLLKTSSPSTSLLQQLAQRCQGCAGCAFVCPTCSCFTISDQKLSGQHGERVRRWDACTFSGFTQMAGHHNPVDGESERMTKRFLHKLKHDVAQYGQVSCVGCGRCVDMCFGGVDIVRFIRGVCAEAEEQKG